MSRRVTGVKGGLYRGVSLLEMLVALTILATSAAVLFDWLYQVNLRLRHLNAQQAQAMAQMRAVGFLDTVNPAATPAGRQVFSDFAMEWQAQPTTPMRPTLDANDGQLRMELAIFAVHVKLRQPDSQQVWVEFDTRLPGWSSLAGGSAGVLAGLGAQ